MNAPIKIGTKTLTEEQAKAVIAAIVDSNRQASTMHRETEAGAEAARQYEATAELMQIIAREDVKYGKR